MPQIQLDVHDAGGRTLPTPAGGTVYLPQRRLHVWARFGRDILARQAVIDTGAPACILSQLSWDDLDARGDISWVAHPPPGVRNLPRIDVHGGNYPYRLGRIRLQLMDLDGNQLAPHDVFVICTEDAPVWSGDPPQLPRLWLVGLADVMHGRTLRLDASADGTQWAATLAEP